MKKLLFVLAFSFFGQQAFSQMYIVSLSSTDYNHPECVEVNGNDRVLTTIDPQGNRTYICLPWGTGSQQISRGGGHLATVNQELNSIISQGYKIIHTDAANDPVFSRAIWYLAVPWTSVGLTEIDSSNLDLRISPNPANEYINVAVDFKSQPNELVLISEQGYVLLRKDISNIKSGQEFTLDISNVPAGKYLVTVKNEKEYLTPQKLVIF